MRLAAVTALIVAGALAGATAAAAKRTIPADATALIKRVHSAASARDYATLKKSMVTEFVWSFGGDSDSSQAVAAWREDRTYLTDLTRVTGGSCAYIDRDIVQCPGNAGINPRAGFKATDAGWRMIYFVGGD